MLSHNPRKERGGGEAEQYVSQVVKYDQNSKTVPVTSGGGISKQKKQQKKHCSSHRSSSKLYTLYICQLIHGENISLLEKGRRLDIFSWSLVLHRGL